jgi:hypothetical protein
VRKDIECGVACVAILAKEEAPGLPITGASAVFLASHRAKEEPQHALAYFDERVGQGFGRRYTQMFLSRWPASLPPRFQLGTDLD